MDNELIEPEPKPEPRHKAITRAKKAVKSKRSRRTSLFPASSFEEALTIPNAIQKYAAGQKVRRLTLFDKMEKSPDSGISKQLIVNSNKYGLTTGSYVAEFLELTQLGNVATNIDINPKDKLRARFKLAFEDIQIFKELYDSQIGQRLPDASVLVDLAEELGVPDSDASECIEIFIVNAKFLGVLKPIAGAERIVPIDQALDELTGAPQKENDNEVLSVLATSHISAAAVKIEVDYDWNNICFYISPIGEEDTETRKHSDLFLGSLVEPALEESKLKVIRADKIGKAGMITAQIIEYVLKSKLVIADLSYHNPNVFYELALRHVCRLPTVQIIRKIDGIPFDLDQFRTIQIDTTDIFTLVPNLQSYRAEIATQVRMALKDPDSVDNPISTYYPQLKTTWG